MLAEEKKFTIDEYMRLPIGAPYQYINGCLVDWPSRTPIHQTISIRLSQIILNYLDSTNNNGVVLAAPM
ncbi:Uma2 family endonuclease [Mucilaginibacter sp.]|uniref:Uma2 family endonuclease n=1 Tax=Mucilaginibacter sp. TaxID=1882438 RepID=UPI00260F4598|nr:Uma2 family endonuclease [Mucilaginibacter sp.]MDB5029598.1 Uma2 family endonuclease [Mucilaginibacter sp.]